MMRFVLIVAVLSLAIGSISRSALAHPYHVAQIEFQQHENPAVVPPPIIPGTDVSHHGEGGAGEAIGIILLGLLLAFVGGLLVIVVIVGLPEAIFRGIKTFLQRRRSPQKGR
jgi:hypothetical protein